eukprot:3953956-Prymnesium_polylepis.1
MKPARIALNVEARPLLEPYTAVESPFWACTLVVPPRVQRAPPAGARGVATPHRASGCQEHEGLC